MIAGRLLRTAHLAGSTYVESGCGQRAAAISYHVIFSLVPFLALLLTVLELVLPDSAHDRVVDWLVSVAPLPIDVSTSVEGAIQQAGAEDERAVEQLAAQIGPVGLAAPDRPERQP